MQDTHVCVSKPHTIYSSQKWWMHPSTVARLLSSSHSSAGIPKTTSLFSAFVVLKMNSVQNKCGAVSINLVRRESGEWCGAQIRRTQVSFTVPLNELLINVSSRLNSENEGETPLQTLCSWLVVSVHRPSTITQLFSHHRIFILKTAKGWAVLRERDEGNRIWIDDTVYIWSSGSTFPSVKVRLYWVVAAVQSWKTVKELLYSTTKLSRLYCKITRQPILNKQSD